jgi:hypothetical protein
MAVTVNEELVIPSKTWAFLAPEEKWGCNGSWPECVAWITMLSGRVTLGPNGVGWRFFRTCWSWVPKKWLDVPLSAIAMMWGVGGGPSEDVELFDATFESSDPHRQVGGQLLVLPPILFLKVAASWWSVSLPMQSWPRWLHPTCVQQYLEVLRWQKLLPGPPLCSRVHGSWYHSSW